MDAVPTYTALCLSSWIYFSVKTDWICRLIMLKYQKSKKISVIVLLVHTISGRRKKLEIHLNWSHITISVKYPSSSMVQLRSPKPASIQFSFHLSVFSFCLPLFLPLAIDFFSILQAALLRAMQSNASLVNNDRAVVRRAAQRTEYHRESGCYNAAIKFLNRLDWLKPSQTRAHIIMKHQRR